MSTISIGNLKDNYFSIDFAGKTDPTDTYRFDRLNPGSFRVTAEGFSSVVGMQLLDSQGKVVKDIETDGTNSGTFSIDNLGATNYALKISAPSRDTNYQVSLTPDGKVDPLTGLGVTSGFFTADSTGQVGFDWLHDGGNYQGEVAVFSVQGMENFDPSSEEFIKEAARRALSNSLFGHVVISDPIEGANPLFNGSLGEENYNGGQYSGPKTFFMKPGEAFAVMLVPNGTVQDVFNNPGAGGDKRPLLSLSSLNPDDAFLSGQIADVTGKGKAFAMEDQRVDTGSDKDYNDLVFNLTGATGKAVSIDKVIDPAKDWTKLDGGKKLIDYVASKQPVQEPPVAVTPPVEPTPPVAVTPPVETTPPVAVEPPSATIPPVEPTPPSATIPPVETIPPVAVEPPSATIPPVEPTPPVAVEPPSATIPPVEPTPPSATIPPIEQKLPVERPIALAPPIEPKLPVEPPAIDSEPPIETVLPISSPAENRAFIGIFDTGFAPNNPDLDYSKVTLGRDRIDKDSNPLFTTGTGNEHGTFSWGLVSAIQGNDKGVDGYNDKANVYLSRAIGSGEWDLALTDFVGEAKAQKQKNAIALLPLDLTQKNADGSITTRYEFTPRERAALENARQNGVLLVVAAGNDGGVMSVLGQSSQEFENILTVGSSDGFGRSDYSSYGYGLDILVPGGTIDNPTLSTVGDDIGTMSGTSASAAKAAGMASKVWEANPDLNPTQIIDILTGSAIDLKEPGWDQETGFGVVNLNKAVQVAKETAPQAYIPTPFSNPTTWGLEGLVTPLERATADQFNGKYYEWESRTLEYGDTLSQIALDTMGDASADAYNWIAEHNNISIADEIQAGATIQVPKEVAQPVDPGPGTNDPGPVITDPGPGTNDPGPVITDPGPGTNDPGPVITDPGTTLPPSSISLNGHTIGGNFYPVFQNYQGTLGNPVSDVFTFGGASYQLFDNGSIVSSANGTFPLYGGIRQAFLNTGGLEGWLGAPKSGEKGLGDGNIIQYFENGHIYWNGSKAVAYKEGTGLPSNNSGNSPVKPNPIPKPGNPNPVTNPSNPDPINSDPTNPDPTNPDPINPSPLNIKSTVNFDLQNQNLWNNGFQFGGGVSGSWAEEKPIGEIVSIGAEFKAGALLSTGTVDVSFPALFDISYANSVKADTVAVTFKPTLTSEGKLQTQLGVGAYFGGKAFVKFESVDIPLFGKISPLPLEVSLQANTDQILSGLFSPVTIDPSLAANTYEMKNGKLTATDDSFWGIDIASMLNKSNDTDFPMIGNLGLNVKQESFMEVKGFKIDYDDQENGNEFEIGFNELTTQNIPAGMKQLRVQPIADLWTEFTLNLKSEVGISLSKSIEKLKLPKSPFNVEEAVKSLLPKVEAKLSSEKQIAGPWNPVNTKFNPFQVANYWKSISLVSGNTNTPSSNSSSSSSSGYNT
ncbi:S8 family serine peptidase [Tychonema sp. LEGE 07203]|uniref:S8 family serine peptidase n=1 Tax=Tychonema sp. LEGE 07203 TaxID=1828671 RepID=UPI0018824FE6|nr:S8 family serine peptidase [Tychonema sp. LEGE 07203]MBE9094624.1 S8 family serine peptidase [Tychonema sp. LEGE 07203]